MKLSVSALKKTALIVVGFIVAVLLFLWQGLPRMIQWQAEKFVAEKTGHRLTLDRPEFNPFRLALRLGKLRLTDAEDKPLLSFDGLLVDLSAASIVERALVLDAIRLDGPAATVVELPGGGLNWTPFLDALKSKEPEPEKKQGLPRFDIRSFVLAGGKIDYADRRGFGAGFAARIEPLDLTLTDISTLPGDDGKFDVSARTATGARLGLAGEIRLDPLTVNGDFSLADLQLAQLGPYLKNVLPVPPEGVAALTARYRAGNVGDQLDARVEQLAAKLTGLRVAFKESDGPVATVDAIELKNGRFQLASREFAADAFAVAGGKLALPGIESPPQFGALSVEDIRIALAARNASIGKATLADAAVQALRKADGRIDLLEALAALAAARPAVAEPLAGKSAVPVAEGAAEAAPPWQFKVGQMAVANLAVVLRDGGVTPPAELALDDIMLEVDGVSHDLAVPLPVRLSFAARSGGRFEASGKVVPAGPAVDADFRLSDLALRIAQPYLAAKTTLQVAGGKLSAKGSAHFDARDAKETRLRGELAVNDLRLTEPGARKPLLAWQSFGTRKLTLTQQRLDLGELRLVGLDTELIIDKDKSINFKRVLKAAGERAPAEQIAAAPPEKAAAPPAPTFAIDIDRLRFHRCELDFADHSLVLPFGTRIHNLRGSIAGLSNRPGAAGQIELDGEVDDYGMARAVGQVDLFNPTDRLDMRVQFRNVEMTRLTPYTATFAGRKIDSGKLSLDLQYKIKQRQLQGDNQVIMDQLTLGERVESPTAKDLPLDLALAILKDSSGRIDLGLPVSGSLDDPEFSYGQIVWKAIVNVLTKIVTAPFRALGALFGGGAEEIANVAFEAGAAQLTPPEREKIARLADAMGKRPGLVLAVGGIYAEADRVALQDRQLRRAVLARAGQQVAEKGDPGPISTQQPKVREALEALYKERVGAADLAALKEGFRAANPGQLPESMAGKMVSRLSGLLREKKTLAADEMEKLKGGDFYGILFERLRALETIPAERLQSLAEARGEGVVEVLKGAGVAAERMRLQAPEAARPEEGAGGEIPLRLGLEAAKIGKP